MGTEGQWVLVSVMMYVVGVVTGAVICSVVEDRRLRRKMEAQYEESLRLIRVSKQLLGAGKENGHG